MKVSIIMGSKSDWDVMSAACETLDQFGVPYEKKVISAHRTPQFFVEYMDGARDRGVDVVIARPCHVFGPFFSERDDRVYAQFLRNALNGEDIELKSSGLQLRSWCYVVDCASALIQILLKGESGQAYNVADNQANCSIKELADMISEISGLRTKTPSVSADNPNLASPLQATFDTTRLESLGWRPLPGSLREKLMHTLYSLREN